MFEVGNGMMEAPDIQLTDIQCCYPARVSWVEEHD